MCLELHVEVESGTNVVANFHVDISLRAPVFLSNVRRPQYLEPEACALAHGVFPAGIAILAFHRTFYFVVTLLHLFSFQVGGDDVSPS